MDHSLQTFEQ